jgi:hypothetical protein
LALATLGQPAEEAQIEFLLANQKPDGWWPIYPASASSDNASSYATALCVWALSEHLNRGLVPPTHVKRVEAGTDRGLAWLLSVRVTGRARWSDYPLVPVGRESVGISGLVVHVLHHARKSNVSAIDRLWLNDLPPAVPAVVEFEASNKTVKNEAGIAVQTDDTRHYALQWAVVATADAYPYGTLWERHAAAGWMERALKPLGPSEEADMAALKAGPWVAAELLIALRHLAPRTAALP